MSSSPRFIEQDPSLTAGNQVDFRDVDLHSPEVVELLEARGELFQRKIEVIRGVREPETAERVDTVVNGIVEASKVAEPGKHKIITGSRGEQFVFSEEKYNHLYTVDEAGNVTPRERRVLAMQNPYGSPIRITAPWSTPEDPQTAQGTAEAMLVFGLDDTGELTDDRYLIGDREMLLNNYEPVPAHASENPPTPQFSNISELLFSVTKRAAELDLEAERKLFQERDVDGSHELTRERARLIRDLPDVLAEYKATGGSVPEEVEYVAGSWSGIARACIEQNSIFGMGVLLYPKGSRVSDQNELEKLATRYQPLPENPEQEHAVSIRNSVVGDLEPLQPILEYWIRNSDTGALLEEEVKSTTANIEASILGKNERTYITAVDANDKVVGVMGMVEPGEDMRDYITTAKPIELVNAYVDPTVRGSGIGQQLAAELETRARLAGYMEVIVNSGPRYEETGWPFWTRLYGKPIDVREGLYADEFGDGGDAPVWRKSL